MTDLRARVLRTLRNPKLVNSIGLGLVALVGAYFLGIDPRLVMGLLGGGTGAPTTVVQMEQCGVRPTDPRSANLGGV